MIDVYKKIRSVEFDKLPEPVQQVYLAPPVISIPVEQDDVAFKTHFSAKLEGNATEAYMPKLGIKSWRGSGSLGLIYQGVKISSVVALLLKNPTKAQSISAQAWLKFKLPLMLYLSPYVDFSQITEVRFLVNQKGTSRISSCLRGQSMESFQLVLPKITDFANKIALHLPDYSHILDIAYFPDGNIRLVEVNPGLTPKDLKILQVA